MDDSFRFFENRKCKYFPCHEMPEGEGLNCLFCFCPLYNTDCPGDPRFTEKDGRRIKVCTGCTFPHRAENYDEIIKRLRV